MTKSTTADVSHWTDLRRGGAAVFVAVFVANQHEAGEATRRIVDVPVVMELHLSISEQDDTSDRRSLAVCRSPLILLV